MIECSTLCYTGQNKILIPNKTKLNSNISNSLILIKLKYLVAILQNLQQLYLMFNKMSVLLTKNRIMELPNVEPLSYMESQFTHY